MNRGSQAVALGPSVDTTQVLHKYVPAPETDDFIEEDLGSTLSDLDPIHFKYDTRTSYVQHLYCPRTWYVLTAYDSSTSHVHVTYVTNTPEVRTAYAAGVR